MAQRRPTVSGFLLAALVAVASASCWWAWCAWDTTYQVDPVTGLARGPYQSWQVTGCILSLIALTAAAAHKLSTPVVVLAVTLGFAVAWSVTAASTDETGLWAVGAILVTVGLALGTALVALVSKGAWRRRA